MIKGRVKLDLCDALTGKVKERIEGNNYFTDAINSLLNKAPMGCDRKTLDSTQVSVESELNMVANSLGGVIIFPDEVSTNMVGGVDYQLYEPLSHQPTAYSRYGARDGSDLMAGAFNNADSKDILDSNGRIIGYQFVHEWGSSYGNGTIRTVCLTHKYGGEAYGKHGYFGTHTLFTMGDIGTNCRFLGILGEYIYYWNRHPNFQSGDEIRRIRRPVLEMMINTPAFNNTNSELVWTNPESGTARIGLSETDKAIYILSGSAGTTKKLTTIDLDSDPVGVTTTTLTFPSSIPLPPTRRFIGIAKRGDYFYLGKTIDSDGNLIVSKMKANGTGYDEITISVGSRYGDIQYSEDTGDILGGDIFAIDDEDNVIAYDVPASDVPIIAGKRVGVWQAVERLSTDSNRADPLMWQINPYYMATKFVLEDAVTKDQTLTMKLVYEVTHE